MDTDKKLNPYPGGIILSSLRDIWRIINPHVVGVRYDDVGMSLIPVSATVSTKVVPQAIQDVFTGHESFPDVSIYVHGSWADDSNNAFSDIDDLIIYPQKYNHGMPLVKLRKWLNQVEMRFCRLDPLQHHGHWILRCEDMTALDESYMPLTVLDGAICLNGKTAIHASINTTRSIKGDRRAIISSCSGIEQLFLKYQSETINIYEMKCMIGSVLLMPAYLFQIRGQRVSKKWAIEHAHLILSNESLELVRICESIRKSWGVVTRGLRFSLLKVLANCISNPHIYRMLAKKVAPRLDKLLLPQISGPAIRTFLAGAIECMNTRNDDDA